jgi:hypothetical protein
VLAGGILVVAVGCARRATHCGHAPAVIGAETGSVGLWAVFGGAREDDDEVEHLVATLQHAGVPVEKIHFREGTAVLLRGGDLVAAHRAWDADPRSRAAVSRPDPRWPMRPLVSVARAIDRAYAAGRVFEVLREAGIDAGVYGRRLVVEIAVPTSDEGRARRLLATNPRAVRALEWSRQIEDERSRAPSEGGRRTPGRGRTEGGRGPQTP